MAISTAVQPVRVENADSDQKCAKTVTIAEPAITGRTKGCQHIPNQNSLCHKCGIVSHKQDQEKKSILIHKKNPSYILEKLPMENEVKYILPRRHSDDIGRAATTLKTGTKQKSFSKTTDNLDHSIHYTISKPENHDIKPNTRLNVHTIQKSSSLKYPMRKTLTAQTNPKNTKTNFNDKKRAANSSSGIRSGSSSLFGAFSAHNKSSSPPKAHAASSNSTSNKVKIYFRKYLKY